jgi:hypothetical protein
MQGRWAGRHSDIDADNKIPPWHAATALLTVMSIAFQPTGSTHW